MACTSPTLPTISHARKVLIIIAAAILDIELILTDNKRWVLLATPNPFNVSPVFAIAFRVSCIITIVPKGADRPLKSQVPMYTEPFTGIYTAIPGVELYLNDSKTVANPSLLLKVVIIPLLLTFASILTLPLL